MHGHVRRPNIESTTISSTVVLGRNVRGGSSSPEGKSHPSNVRGRSSSCFEAKSYPFHFNEVNRSCVVGEAILDICGICFRRGGDGVGDKWNAFSVDSVQIVLSQRPDPTLTDGSESFESKWKTTKKGKKRSSRERKEI
ncbi:AP2/ERF domain-containing protein [Psidium guajava]|nr:AP2/ERF domain-containing protein [Psidium guajava]